MALNLTDTFDSAITTSLTFLEDKYMAAAVSTAIVLYGALAAPELPRSIAVLFKNPLFKFGVIFLIAYMSSKNPTVAIIAAIGLVVSMMTLTKYETKDLVEDKVAAEVQKVLMPEGEYLPEEAYPEAEQEAYPEAEGEYLPEEAYPEAEGEALGLPEAVVPAGTAGLAGLAEAGPDTATVCNGPAPVVPTAPAGNAACPFPSGICHYNNTNNHPDNYNHYNYNNDTYDYSKSTADVAGDNVGPVGVQSGFTKSAMPL